MALQVTRNYLSKPPKASNEAVQPPRSKVLVQAVGETGTDTNNNSSSQNKIEDNSNKKSKTDIQLKEFFWDHFLIYIATGIGLLTILDASIQFLRSNGGLQCFVPMNVLPQEFTRDNAAFVNSFCLGSLTWSEYYSVFVLIQGIVIVAPHYLWSSLFSGRFDFFVDLVKQLDRLRDSNTGDYRPRNIDIVKKLEQEFPEKWKWTGIFMLYIAKLCAQLVCIVGSLIINIALFPQEDFSYVFPCPRGFNASTDRVEGWSFPEAVSCSYPSFRVLSRIQIANYVLLVLALGSVVFGILWCFKRHPSSLGYKQVAKFAFSSCLAPEEYVSVPLWKKPLNPRIHNDLDFLIMRLFRADSGHGRVFKDIQIAKEIEILVSTDHLQLHHLHNAIIDRRRRSELTMTRQEMELHFRHMYFEIGLQRTEENVVNDIMENRFGNMTFEPIGGLRSELFTYFPKSDASSSLAYEISFGTVGFSLLLARAFNEVISVDFNSYFQNPNEVVREKESQVNYTIITVRHDILSQDANNISKMDHAVDSHLEKKYVDSQGRLIKGAKKISLVLIGPFTRESTKAIVNLHIERLHIGDYFDKDTSLFVIRPVKIAWKNVTQHFRKFVPSQTLFSKVVDKSATFSATCAGVDCDFETAIFTYKIKTETQV